MKEDKNWLGEVVDIADPNKIGRIKIRVFGKFDDLEVEDIPWAYPNTVFTSGGTSGGGFFSVPKLGSIVAVSFDNGNIYHPEYKFIQNISTELKEEIAESYDNAHSLIYDTVTEGGLKVYFTESKGLVFDFKSTIVNLKPDNSITVITESGDSSIEITNDGKLTITQKGDIEVTSDANINIKCKDATVESNNTYVKSKRIELGNSATEPLILGNKFMSFFNSHTHVTPAGPSSPPTVPMSPVQLSQTSFTKK